METMTIPPDHAPTISEVFRLRVEMNPEKIAYQQYDVASQSWQASSWQQMAIEVGHWQEALQSEGLEPGDRVAIMLKNCRNWIVFDQAALGLGLITVPIFADDRPDNVAYILEQTEAKLLLVQDRRHWAPLQAIKQPLPSLQRIISVQRINEEDNPDDTRLKSLVSWLFGRSGELITTPVAADTLASIVYTSGTTGRPKGVMLSHQNIIHNAWAALSCGDISADDRFLSFLPLSHMLERTDGYLLPMMAGAEVVYSRSNQQLADDFIAIKPTVIISVPRIYERVYQKINSGVEKKSRLARALFNLTKQVGWDYFEYRQGRKKWSPKLLLWPLLQSLVASKILAKLGGRLRYAICGGAPLNSEVAQLFISLGTPLYQGYGLTESSPVISVNRPDDNIPDSIGRVLPDVEVRIGENNELQTRSPSVMAGYWRDEQATKETFTEDGWLRTGDKATVDDDGHLYLTGRIKEILVLANGEKVPPGNMEGAITLEPLFSQVVVVGEGKPYLSALLVLEHDAWQYLAGQLGIDPKAPAVLADKQLHRHCLARLNERLSNFPGYAQIRRVHLSLEPWSIENDLLTSTLKVKRKKVMKLFSEQIEQLYQGH